MELLSRININLLPLKICMILWWGGNSALISYMAVHMKALGLNVWQVGLIHALLPVAQVSGQLGCGVVADKFKSHKLIILLAKTCAVCALTAISFIPAIQRGDGESLTFFSYMLLRLLFEFCAATTFNLFETIAVLKIRQFPKANFGNQRFFASLGAGTIPSLIGLLMDSYAFPAENLNFDSVSNNISNHTLIEDSASNFNILFYAVDGLIIVSLIVALLFVTLDYKAIQIENEDDPVEETGNFKTLLSIAIKPNASVFVLTVLCLGSFWGYTKIFVPWRMTELGSDKFLIGLCPLLSTAMGLTLILLSARLIKTVGHVPVMVFSLFVYSVRFLSYSLLTSPKYFLIFETLEGFTYHLLWIVVVTYAALLTPASVTASVQGFIGSTHYCVGIGIGGLIGGATISDYGPEISFRGMSVTSLLCAIAAGLFYVFYSRRRLSNL